MAAAAESGLAARAQEKHRRLERQHVEERNAAVDISTCEREAIRTPGTVQNWGVLLALRESPGGEGLRVVQASENTDMLFDKFVKNVLGASLAELLAADAAATVEAALRERLARERELGPEYTVEDEYHYVRSRIPATQQDVEIASHVHKQLAVVELLPLRLGPRPRGDDEWARLEAELRGALDGVENLFRAAQAVTEHLLRAVPYDRVMVYRFCPPEMFGEVIAEARSEARPDLPPYLGLRYPSTDIPRVARTLYEVSHARATADINAMPAIMWARDEAAQPLPVPPPPPPPPPTRVRASAAAGAAVSSPSLSPSLAGAPTAERHTRIDMSFATLRYPSPSHLEYLRNMGVRASMSVSLLAPPAARDPDESPLWGLFIFHHYAERALQFRERVYLKRAGALFAEWLDRFRRASKRASDARLERIGRRYEARIAEAFASAAYERALLSLMLGPWPLSELVDSSAVALCVGEVWLTSGVAPPPRWLAEFARWLATQPRRRVATNSVSGAGFPGAAPPPAVAAGVLGAVVCEAPLVCLLFFRPETRVEVLWGGDPKRPAYVEDGRILPRKSFTTYRELVEQSCQPWEPICALLVERAAAALAPHMRGRECDPARVDPALFSGVSVFAQALHFTHSAKIVTLRSGDAPECTLARNKAFHALFGAAGDVGDESDEMARVLERLGVAEPPAGAATQEGARVQFWSPSQGLRTLLVRRLPVLAVATNERVHHAVYLTDFDDLSFQVRISDAMQAAYVQAENADLLKTQLLSMISHELRTPLNAIIGFSDLLEQHDSLDTDAKEYASDINRAGRHLLTLVNDLLDLTKVEVHGAGRDMEEHSLTDLIVSACKWMENAFATRSQTLTCVVPSEPVVAKVHSANFQRVIVNLLDNASKFTPANGNAAVTLTVGPFANGQGAAVAVTDTGVGIPQQDLGRVFDVFFQSDLSKTRPNAGAGLGLAMVKSVVETMGGAINASSELGKGTTVRFTVPLWRIAKESRYSAERMSAPRVLVFPAGARASPQGFLDRLQSMQLLLDVQLAHQQQQRSLLVSEGLLPPPAAAACGGALLLSASSSSPNPAATGKRPSEPADGAAAPAGKRARSDA